MEGMVDNYRKIGDLIRERREARNWSQADLAQRANTSQQNVARIESGAVKHSRYIQALLDVLGSDLGSAVSHTAEPDDIIPHELLVGKKGMPLYASTEGGNGSIIINFDPIDYLKWPAPLLHVPEGFGVLVSEDSMFPAYEPGDIALVNPRLIPRKGKDCVLLGEDGGSNVRSLIKRFQGHTDALWRVSQWNPPENFDLSKIDWPRCYSVVGRYASR